MWLATIDSKLGINETSKLYDFNKIPDEQFKKNFDYEMYLINQLPINYLRLGTELFANLVDSSGSYKLDRLDYAVETALNAGLKVIMPFFAYSVTNMNYVDEIGALKNLILNVIKRYSGKGIVYEAINETQNGGIYWFGLDFESTTVRKDIAALNEFYAKCVWEYDPTAKFIAGDFPWVIDKTYKRINESISDGVLKIPRATSASYHPYIPGRPELMLEDYRHQDLIQQIKKEGLQVSATEFGFASILDSTDTSHFGPSGYFAGRYDSETQSKYLIRQTLLMDMQGFDKIILFTADNTDKPWTIVPNFYTSGAWNGTKYHLTVQGQAFKSFFECLIGYEFLRREKSDRDIYALRYVSSGKSDLIVAWSTDNKREKIYNDGNNTLVLSDMPQIFVASENFTTNFWSGVNFTQLDASSSFSFSNFNNSIASNFAIFDRGFNDICMGLKNNFGLSISTQSFDLNIPEYRYIRIWANRNFSIARLKLSRLENIFNQYTFLSIDKDIFTAETPEIQLGFDVKLVENVNDFFENAKAELDTFAEKINSLIEEG